MVPVVQPRREPAFNLPPLMVGCIGALVGIHVVRQFLPYSVDLWVIYLFGFTPARYAPAQFIGATSFPGGIGADVWTFATYGFLHGGWLHLLMNLAWLVAFGTPVLRRVGDARFLLLALIGTVAGALAHLVTNWGAAVPMIGASAGISALMAAAVRFVFRSGGLSQSIGPGGRPRPYTPVAPLRETMQDRNAMVFVLVWFAINIVFGIGGVGATEGDSIAWQAHFGGFFAGLLLFPLIDPAVPEAERPDHETSDPFA